LPRKGLRRVTPNIGYRADWREPKLLIIDVVDEKGQMDRDFPSVIDGTLGGPDAISK
jgi:hypothetical protein